MTVREEVQQILDRYSFGTVLTPFSPKLYVDSGEPYPRRNGAVRCVFEITVPERETGVPYVVMTAFNVRHNGDQDRTHRAIWDAIMARLMHEVGEGFRYTGVLLFDPHIGALPR